MNILHIIPILRKGGAERLALDICNELQKRNQVQVKLITFGAENQYLEMTNNIDWMVIPSFFIPSITGKPHKDIARLQKAIENFAPDIIHTHLWEAEIVSRQIDYPPAKWFSHFHDNMKQLRPFAFSLSKESLTNYYERLLLIRKYKILHNHFIAISNNTVKYAKKVLPRKLKKNIHFLPNAIDYKRFGVERKAKQSNVLKLINVGSLVENKNQTFLFSVIEVLIKKRGKIKLIILGDGPLRSNLQQEIQNRKLENYIVLKGNVNDPEQYFWDSDICVHASKKEAFGLVLLEAMAAGLPVVSLNGGGNADLLVNGKNGFMIEEQNPTLFAEKILEIWNDKNVYNEMSIYAQEFAQKYDIKPYVDKMLALYHKALQL